MSHSDSTVRIHFCQVQHRIRLCQSCLNHRNRQSTNSNILLYATWWLDHTGRNTWYCTTGNASVLCGKIFGNSAGCFFILTLIQLPKMRLFNGSGSSMFWNHQGDIFDNRLLTLKMVIWFGGSNNGWPISVRHFNEGHKYKFIPDEWLFLCNFTE